MSPDTILIILAFVFFILGAMRISSPIDWMLAAFAMLTLTLLI